MSKIENEKIDNIDIKASKKAKAKKAKSKKSLANNIKSVKTLSSKKFSKTLKSSEIYTTEYYDLPYSYNQTLVKVLAQTPNKLFVYWDISNDDKNKFKETYGENFFEFTKPVLIVHNLTMHYSFEIDINDFANCWYINVNDSNCNYNIEIGRRPFKNNITFNNNYIYISSSNNIESPNNHILFEKSQNMVYFKNVKDDSIKEKQVANLYFIKNIGKLSNLSELYNNIYKQDNIENLYWLSNPTSGNPTSK